MTDEPEHNITRLEMEIIHRDKYGRIKGIYNDDVPVKSQRDTVTISSDEVGSIDELFHGGL